MIVFREKYSLKVSNDGIKNVWWCWEGAVDIKHTQYTWVLISKKEYIYEPQIYNFILSWK